MKRSVQGAHFDLLRQAQLAHYEGRLASRARRQCRRARPFTVAVADFDKVKFKISLNVFAAHRPGARRTRPGQCGRRHCRGRPRDHAAESFIEKGTPSYLVGQSRLALGEAQLAAGEKVAARASFDAALDELQRTLGPAHPRTARARQFAESLAAAR